MTKSEKTMLVALADKTLNLQPLKDAECWGPEITISELMIAMEAAYEAGRAAGKGGR